MTAKRADFDGDGRAEIPVTSPWGLGILELAGGSLNAPTMQPNGTRFGGWLLNTADNRFDLMGDLDGDGRVEMFVSSPWGIGVLEQAGSTFGCPMLAPNGTRFGGWLLNTADNRFGPLFPLAYSSSPAGPQPERETCLIHVLTSFTFSPGGHSGTGRGRPNSGWIPPT